MKYFEFGKENEKLMVLLHGGGVCYLGAEPAAKALAKDFHVILVAYDGFNPTEPDTEFVSVMDEARRLGDYIVKHYGGKIEFQMHDGGLMIFPETSGGLHILQSWFVCLEILRHI